MFDTYYPALCEHLFARKLSNGLQVLVVPRPGFSKKRAYFVTNYGAIHRRFSLEGKDYETPAGVAHYLEHKLFALPQQDVSNLFAQLGGVVNAFTSYDMTAYYFSCTENFDACLKLLLEFVSTPHFTQEGVEKERGIIDQEIGMSCDEPGSRVFEALMENMFHSHPVRTPVLGTRQSIRQITPQILELCHRAFYSPGNMVLCIVGDVDPEAICCQALEVLGPEPRPVAVKKPFAPEAMTCPRAQSHQSMDIAMPTFCLGFKAEPVEEGRACLRQEIIGNLACELLFGESSELYLRLYEQGLIDSSFGGGFEWLDGCAMVTCGGDSEDAAGVQAAIVDQVPKLLQEGIPLAQLQRIKRSALGRRIRDLDSFDTTCFRLAAYYLAGFDYFRFPEIYDSICDRDILEFLARIIRKERCSLSVIDTLQEDQHG